MKTTAIIIIAKITIFITRDNLPGSVLTRARIMKYRLLPQVQKKLKLLSFRNQLKIRLTSEINQPVKDYFLVHIL